MSEKKKHNQVVLILLAIFLGDYGVHQFVLGNKKRGFMYLFGTILSMVMIVIGYISVFVNLESNYDGGSIFAVLGSFVVALVIGLIILTTIFVFKIIDIVKIATGKVLDADGNSLIEGF